MKIEHHLEICFPQDVPNGTMFIVSRDGKSALVSKVSNSMYIIHKEDGIDYNSCWSINWKNPKIVNKGDKITITA